MSMLSQLVLRPGEFGGCIPAIYFIYASRGPQTPPPSPLPSTNNHHPSDQLSKVLFLDRLQGLSQHLTDIGRRQFALDVFLTPDGHEDYHNEHRQSHGESQYETSDSLDSSPERKENRRHGTFHYGRRFNERDLLQALGPEDDDIRKATVVYVCGPPTMTDEVVALMRAQRGMSEERVMCEKWW